MRDPRDGPVICSSNAVSTGCGHPVDDHVGPGTPNPDCLCCSWRLAERPVVQPVRNPPVAGYSVEEWAAMPRRQRRTLERGARRGAR